MKAAAASVRADAQLFLGDAKGALQRWKSLEASGKVEPGQLGHMAYAAQVAGDSQLADALIARRSASRPSAEDRLLFAQIYNLRGDPAAALPHLDAALAVGDEHYVGFLYEAKATRGRALRLLGRTAEAIVELAEAAALPEYVLPRLGARVRIDRGHLAAEQGDFETAETLFKEALSLDPDDPEARRALELTARRVAWKNELQAGAQAQVEATRAEAESLGRRFRSRESELNALRRELERVKAAQARAEETATAAREEARAAEARARADTSQKLAEELATRELEIEAKADEAIDRALAGVRERCPDALVRLLRVSERTFQKALYTELPAAAVAVLYSGALERGLYMLFVEAFEKWLDEKGRRQAFLAGATREKRGKRVEYFDHFVEAFDAELRGKAPSMGEVARALERRTETYMAPFVEFLHESYGVPDAFYDALADFVTWSKQKLRDPSAHGRGIELGYDELKRFREELLFDFRGSKRGALARLLAERG
ncbi:MAG: tetratricopeptide repeat protein [Archangiaceae bacterium]|nr:tetratricopeptide repeat protein [Archangiaceae bacterium]